MKSTIALLIAGLGLSLAGLGLYSDHRFQNQGGTATAAEESPQNHSTQPGKLWYNCRSREVWTPAKKAWCQKTEVLKNSKYQLASSGLVQLQRGLYENPSQQTTVRLLDQPGTIAYGDLSRDGREDGIAIVAANTGGTGVFVYLTAVMDVSRAPQEGISVLLGDRVRVEALSVKPGQVMVEMLAQGPKDAMCCPTQRVRQTYTLRNNQLVAQGKPVVLPR